MEKKTIITVTATILAPVEKVWKYWTAPQHIQKWNHASEDWHTPRAENDLRAGGKFFSRMEAKDGSFGFDFTGVYDAVKKNEFIQYHIADGRKVEIHFYADEGECKITESFEAETAHSPEQQQAGWQAILNNFKKYVEGN